MRRLFPPMQVDEMFSRMRQPGTGEPRSLVCRGVRVLAGGHRDTPPSWGLSLSTARGSQGPGTRDHQGKLQAS